MRVISPSSASSSLCRIRKRLTWAPAVAFLLGERTVRLLDVARDHVVDQGVAGQFLIGAEHHVVALGPDSDRGEIDVDHTADEVAAVAIGHGFADIGKELQLVLDVFRREQRAVVEPADILGAVDDLQVAGLGVEEAGIAGLDVAVRRSSPRAVLASSLK